MRLVTLSDYAAEQIGKARDTRNAANDKVLADWQAAADRREAAIAEQAQAMRQAWRERRFFAAAIGLIRTFAKWMVSKPPRPTLLIAGNEEGRLQGGQEGESRVVASLSRLLDDQWVAFKGYFNRGGETDLLLVGPTAVVALEVKYLNGMVHCDGNTWTRDKSDRYGNVVERAIPVRDAKGRSPGQQVNATADALQAQLARRGQVVPVQRAVILAHNASSLGRVREPGVQFIGVLADHGFHAQFLGLVQPPPGRPDLDVAALAQVVAHDHEYHVRARARRNAPAPASALGAAVPPGEHGPAPALARPRPIRLMPPNIDAIRKPSDLEVRQAKILSEDIIALHRSQGRNQMLDRKVRQAISGQLQTGGRYTVLSMAQFGAGGEPQQALLRRLIRECRQTVELEDRTLHAVVVPVAVHWQVPEGADWSGVWISSVGRDDLRLVHHTLRLALDVDKLVFGHRLYEGGRLESLDARLLRQVLMQLEAGMDPDLPELKPAVVAPAPAADWNLVYFLAVAVTEPGEPLFLDDDARRASAGRHELLIADALTKAAMEATGTPGAARAVVEDIWTLADGVPHGRRLQRRHLLESMLASSTMEGGCQGRPLRCWYTQDQYALRIRLLVDWGPLRAEHEFSALDDEQPLEAFRTLLNAAIAAQVPPGTSIQVQELHLHDYRKQAQAIGLSWIGQSASVRKNNASHGAGQRPAPRPKTSADPTARSPRR